MADAIKGLFSSAPGLERVNIFGLIVMLAAVILLLFSGKIASRMSEAKKENGKIILKFSSLIICVAGFIIAVI